MLADFGVRRVSSFESEKVGGADFFDIPVFNWIEVNGIDKARLFCLGSRKKGRSIVAAGLDVAAPLGGGPVVTADHDALALVRTETASVVGAHGADKDPKDVLRGGLDADVVADSQVHRSQVESRAAAVRRNVWHVRAGDLFDAAQEESLRDFGALQVTGALVHPARVFPRPECVNPAIRSTLGLHPFEELLTVMEALAALGQLHGLVFHDAAYPPHPEFEDRFETVGAGEVVEPELGKVEIHRLPIIDEVVSRFLHAGLQNIVGVAAVPRAFPGPSAATTADTTDRITGRTRFAPLDTDSGISENDRHPMPHDVILRGRKSWSVSDEIELQLGILIADVTQVE